MFFCLVTGVGQRKNSESPWGHEPQTSDALPLNHRDSRVSEAYYEVHVKRVLHTARISNVDSVKFVNRIIEMVSFELGKEIEKDVFCLVTGTKKFWVPRRNQTSDLRIPRSDTLPLIPLIIGHRYSTHTSTAFHFWKRNKLAFTSLFNAIVLNRIWLRILIMTNKCSW